jgi:DNA mismatch repair protein MutS
VDLDTPVMAQYAAAKRRFPDALLFFQMGDFYELFYEDARTASKALGLTLTARDREKKIPMAGVPVRSADGYLRRLVRQGHRVAICEQTEPPGGKGLVERSVVRVVTAGTLTEDGALDPSAANYLLAARPGRRRAGLAWVDLSTGRFLVADVEPGALVDEVLRVAPAEALLPEGPDGDDAAAALERAGLRATRAPAFTFAAEAASRALREHFRVQTLAGFSLDRDAPSLCAAGAALAYLATTQMKALAHVTRVERHDPGVTLLVDRTTRRRLELVERADGSRAGTLLEALDETRTAMGGRTLREWVLAPLRDAQAIGRRLEGVEELVRDALLRRDLREALSEVRDVERILARAAVDRANARDLLALRASLAALPRLREPMTLAYSGTLGRLRERIETFPDLHERLARAIVDDPPTGVRDGGMFRAGYSTELDDLRSLSRSGKEWIAAYQAREAERTGIPGLKAGFNRVFGYYLEVPKAHASRVPPDYVRRQTLASAERYVTADLREHEDRVLTADERAKELEARLFQEVREAVSARIPALQAACQAVAETDVLQSLAEVAARGAWVRPEILDDRTLDLADARHPVVERHLPPGERFVPNDVALDDERRVALVTGPNMAGKSTYIRQAALLVVLAQMGSFVPAARARLGLCDRVFARVGAEDDLTRGQSTFMVEMSEAAHILHHATRRSLVILDEIGRGTSTFDGIALAWAITEYLSEVAGSRTLFATHYAELTDLARTLPSVRNLNVAVREWGEDVVFLRRIQEGASDRSYGIHVARLAGVPDAVVERAKAVLGSLEAGRSRGEGDATFFGAPPRPATPAPRDLQLPLFPAAPDAVREEVLRLDLDRLTPLEALNALSRLHALAKEGARPGGGDGTRRAPPA